MNLFKRAVVSVLILTLGQLGLARDIGADIHDRINEDVVAICETSESSLLITVSGVHDSFYLRNSDSVDVKIVGGDLVIKNPQEPVLAILEYTYVTEDNTVFVVFTNDQNEYKFNAFLEYSEVEREDLIESIFIIDGIDNDVTRCRFLGLN